MPFSPGMKKIISLLSSGHCANPKCRKRLFENDMIVGEYCHIQGEREESARFNSNQSEIERNDHRNGLMLCPNCHT